MISVLFALIFLGLIGCFSFGIAGVVLKKRKWLICCLAFGVCLFCDGVAVWVLVPDSPYVRDVSKVGQVPGVYRLMNGFDRDLLKDIGYSDFSGEIVLSSDGCFIAKRIPASFVHGFDESFVEFTGGYYNLSGTWELESDGRGQWQVKMGLDSAQLFDIPLGNDKNIAGCRKPFGPIFAYLLKGSTSRLAFVYVDAGGDDCFIGYSKVD